MGSRVKRWAQAEFRREPLLRSVTSGMLIYVLEILFVLSFAALIFSGDLTGVVSYGVGFIVLGDALILLVVAVTSSYGGSIAIEQDAPGAILAVAVAAMLVTLPATATLEVKFASAVVMIVGITLLTGLAFIALGHFKLGGLARFLPYPVMGGFLAGTGWLLLSGGLSVMTNLPVGMAIFLPEQFLRWLPGLVMGIILVFLVNRSSSVLILPLSVVISLGLFYLAAWALGASLDDLFAMGWLLGPFPSGGVWQFPLNPQIIAQAEWSVMPSQISTAALIIFVSGVALLLNANSLELVTKRDIDLNRELVSAGVGNLASGLVGGIVGYQAISLSTLNHRMNGGLRLGGIIAGIGLVITLFLGASLFSYIPRFILGGLLAFLGLSLLVDWVYKAWFNFPRIEFFIILLILVVIAVYGFLMGIAIGLIATIFLFVIGYSRVSVVKSALHGTAYRSRVSRSHFQHKRLDELRQQIYILQLQGFIFFGSANSLYEHFRARINNQSLPPVKYMLFDCSRVTGMDSTGLLSFSKMLQLGREVGSHLIVIGLSDQMRAQFAAAGFKEQPGGLSYFFDLDRGVEWCENQLILATDLEQGDLRNINFYLYEVEPADEEIKRLVGYMKRIQIPAGEVIVRQGDESQLIYFLESGQVTAQLENLDRPAMRLETMQAGRIFGELGVYLHQARSATVVADQDCVLYTLSGEDLKRIEQADPPVAATLHRIVLHLMSERVMQLTRALDAMQR